MRRCATRFEGGSGQSLCQAHTFDNLKIVSICARHAFLVASLLVGLAACASIVKLDDSDPIGLAGISNEAGTPSGSSSGADLDGGITTEAGVSLSTGSIAFHNVACGIEQKQDVTITNTSAAPINVQVSLPADPVFSVVGSKDGTLAFTVAPNAAQSFTIAAMNPIAGASSADVLVKIGEEEHHVPVSLETAGGNLTFEPPALDFGQIRLTATSEKQKVVFRNDGTNPLTIKSIGGAADFVLVDGASPLPLELAPGTAVEKEVQMVAGTIETGVLTEELVPVVDGLCGDPPKINLKGQRKDAPYTVNPLSIDFSDLDCNKPGPAAKTITISNYINASKSIAVAMKSATSPFKATASAASVNATPDPKNPSTVTVSVSLPTPPQVPGDINDTLLVTVDGGTPVEVPVHVRIRGALLSVSATSLTLRRSDQSDGTGSVTLSNTGNVNACVQYTWSNWTFISEDWGCGHNGCYITDNSDQINAGSSTAWTAKYYSGSSSVTITANIARCGGYGGSTAPLCGAAPKITVTPTN